MGLIVTKGDCPFNDFAQPGGKELLFRAVFGSDNNLLQLLVGTFYIIASQMLKQQRHLQSRNC